MSKHEIDKGTEELANNLNLNPEEALKLAQQQEKERQLISKLKNGWNSFRDIGVAAGLPQILTLLSSPSPLALGATVGSFVASVWGREQQNKLLDEIKELIDKKINETNAKIKEPALSFDEFMELFVQAMNIVSKSKSELKRQALAKALVNSLIPPNSPFTGKQALLRILSQLSDEEMIALQVMRDEKPHIEQTFLVTAEIEARLRCSPEDALVVCQSLRQLGLVNEPNFNPNAVSIEYSPELQGWRVNELAQKLIKWVTEEVPPANETEANIPKSKDNAEKAAWSQLTAEQFFSGYSEADAIYDQI
jgi:hypothetical protein